jgi:hypothetical protein
VDTRRHRECRAGAGALTFAPLPPKGKLSFTTDLRVMAEKADFIQENIPEQLPLKQRMLAEVSRYTGRM